MAYGVRDHSRSAERSPQSLCMIGEALSIDFLREISKTQPHAHVEDKYSLSSLRRRSSKPDASPIQISQRAVLAEHDVLDSKIKFV